MAIITGASGSVAITSTTAFEEVTGGANPIASIQKWQATISNDFFDSAVFGSNTVGDTFYRGRHKISGTCEGFLFSDGTFTNFETDFALGLTTSTLTLTASTSRTYIFPAMLNDWNVVVSVEAGGPLNRVTFSFVNSGPITSIN